LVIGSSLWHVSAVRQSFATVKVDEISASEDFQGAEIEVPEATTVDKKFDIYRVPELETDDVLGVASDAVKEELGNLGELFTLRFPEVLPSGELGATVHIEKLAGQRTVRVVNFWATWCEPCKREFAEFKAMSERDNWGSEVRFLPVLLNNEYKKAGRMTRLMPSHSRQLATHTEFIQEALWGEGLLPRGQELILPITLVVDCHDKIVFSVPGGALNNDTSVQLAGKIAEFRNKLGSCPRDVKTVVCPPGARPNTEGGCDRKLPDLGVL